MGSRAEVDSGVIRHRTSILGPRPADLGGVYVQGADILRWNAEGKLVSFTVMVRPLRGLHKLVELMALQLDAGQA